MTRSPGLFALVLAAGCGGRAAVTDRAGADGRDVVGPSGTLVDAGLTPEGNAAGSAGGGSFGGARGDGGAASGASAGTANAGSGGVGAGGGAGGNATGGAAGNGGAAGGPGGAGGACASDAAAISGTQLVYDREASVNATPSSRAFFDFPWPELSRNASELAGFPNPVAAQGCDAGAAGPLTSAVISALTPDAYRSYVAELVRLEMSGAGNNGAAYFRFDGLLDAAALPEPAETLTPTSPILLVNVDAGSATYGALVPATSRVYTASRYLEPNTLAVMPFPGFPLAADTRYAVLVQRALGDAAGAALGSPLEFEALKRGPACDDRHRVYLDAFRVLEELHEISRGDIAAMTLFDTGDPTLPLKEVSDSLHAVSVPEALADLAVIAVDDDGSSGYYVIHGTFETLIQQQGSAPHLPPISANTSGTLDVTLDANDPSGSFLWPEVATARGGADSADPRTEPIQYRLSLPTARVTGTTVSDVPLVIYGPGTGGGVTSPFDDGVAADLAASGIALLVTEPPLHAGRAHSENVDSELLSLLGLLDQLSGSSYATDLIGTVESGDLFFNPLNLRAARGNAQQAAVDYLWQARLFATLELSATLDGEVRTVRFDPGQVDFFGHSQGASIGPLLAHSETLRAAVLSAPGGHIPSVLLDKTLPSDRLSIDNMLEYVVCDDPGEPLGIHHPWLNLLGQWFDAIDGVNYARELVSGDTPKSTFVILGQNDHYSPASGNNALVSSARLPQATPALTTVSGIGLLDLLYPATGFSAPSAPLSGNLGGSTTGGFRQYADTGCTDGHFVYSCNASARSDWRTFLTSFTGGIPTIP